ncbi:MAG: ROK family transcriptional regulator [Acidobacteria bacterium]|nr:ROK family transcriptional regulator [Acidobacteriota bacterium]
MRKSDLREANQRLLLNIIRQHPVSRADIVRITGFSASSVTFVVNRMIKQGLLSESRSAGPAQVGRRPLLLRLQPGSLLAAGVEIARSEARVAIADVNGVILKQRTVPWHPDHHIFLVRVRETIRGLVATLASGRLLGVGVSLAGTIDRTAGHVVAAENLGWLDVDAGSILSHGSAEPFYFENDAKSRALAERWFCPPGAKQLDNFVFVALRPGLGTGVISDGRLLHGAFGAASEFGHTSLYPDGRRCVCGGIGCWEEYAAQRSLERLYCEKRRAAHQPQSDPAGTDVDEIIRLARNGSPLALDVLREIATYLGMGFLNLNAAFDPEAIVVGDYLASAWDLMKDWVWETMRARTAQQHLSHLRIIPSIHGNDSALKGALALVLSDFFTEYAPPAAKSTPRKTAHSRRSH